MPAIFHKADSEWRAERLATKHAILGFDPMRLMALEAASPSLPGDCIALMHIDCGRKWIAFIPDSMHILHNGQPVMAGLRMLAHGDSLAAAHGGPVFFSTEDVACVEPFAGAEPVSCPRCKCEIAPGQPSVRCASCNVVHHELADRNCWTYAPKCAVCSQPTALDIGLRWSPEAL